MITLLYDSLLGLANRAGQSVPPRVAGAVVEDGRSACTGRVATSCNNRTYTPTLGYG